MAEQVPVVCDVLATIESGNWDRLARLLHQEIHWTTVAEDELHGPEAVIERLSKDPRQRRRPTTRCATGRFGGGSTVPGDGTTYSIRQRGHILFRR